MTSMKNCIRTNAAAVHGHVITFHGKEIIRGNQTSTEARNEINVVQSLFIPSAFIDLSRQCSTLQHSIVSTLSAHICDFTCMLYRPNKKRGMVEHFNRDDFMREGVHGFSVG
ncbi:hypothetical protein PanWU01x14_297510 [Parasponia andersonii]|uniref:Uncharacterized protein n=1 Tax=Parasponia andersonii TaxID=3476 RepID=A0A2P5AVC3_PARAD|nr:hypothetical protein PanWU01x14_297510 [Parasponia andersonii]